MCDPLTIASIALTAGSVVANSVASGQQQRARDDVLAAERMRQQRLDSEAWAVNDASRDQFVGYQPQQAERAAQLGDYLGTEVAPDANTAAASVMPSSESGIVNRELETQRGDAQQYVDQQAGALGNLRSFGDLLGDKTRQIVQDSGQIGQIARFKAGSNGVLPFELDDASRKGEGLMLLADVLSGAGSIAGSAGLSGQETALHKMFGMKAPKVAGNVSNLAGKTPFAPGAMLRP